MTQALTVHCVTNALANPWGGGGQTHCETAALAGNRHAVIVPSLVDDR